MKNSFSQIITLIMVVMCSFSTVGCTFTPRDHNIEWVSKYNFFDLYQRKISGGYFNPGSGLRLEKIVVPDENTIILAGEKKLWKFYDDPKAGSCVVLFVSKDKGKSYKEILLSDTDLVEIYSKDDYLLISSYSMEEGNKKYQYNLLNIKSLELKKIEEYYKGEVLYRGFDGRYVLISRKGSTQLVNLVNEKETYTLPAFLNEQNYGNIGDGKIAYLNQGKFFSYDVREKRVVVEKELGRKYTSLRIINSEPILTIYDKEKNTTVYYDLNENKLYETNDETRDYYRYKNFVCDYTNLGANPTIRYSYDYGNTWTTHNVLDFTILQNLFGFYKDQFLVTKGIFWHGDSPESGGRIMVGEFNK